MSDAVLSTLTMDSLRDLLQSIGYRTEALVDPVSSLPYLRSATSGITFDVRPGDMSADKSFTNVALVAILQIQGNLPLEVVNRWNATRRFARLQFSPPYLVLTMDVLAVSTTTTNLRGHIEIWDRLLQDMIMHLREELRLLAAQNQAAAPAPASAPVREAPAAIETAPAVAPSSLQ
jgi:hypothetical protein